MEIASYNLWHEGAVDDWRAAITSPSLCSSMTSDASREDDSHDASFGASVDRMLEEVASERRLKRGSKTRRKRRCSKRAQHFESIHTTPKRCYLPIGLFDD